MSIDLAVLAGRLAAAEDRLAILDLEGEYARSWDSGDSTGWAAIFTDDGVFEMLATGSEKERTIRGIAALKAFCDEMNGFYRGLHFMHLPRLVLGEDSARAQVHFQWVGLYRSGSTYNGEHHARGYYDVTYRKVNGNWRIGRRVETLVTGAIVESFDPYVRVDLEPN